MRSEVTRTLPPPLWPLLEGVCESDAALIMASLERRRYPPGSTLLEEGDHPGEMFIIASGTADVHASAPDGRPERVGTAGPGTTVGEMGALSGRAASCTVTAVTALDVFALSHEHLDVLTLTCPAFRRNLVAIVAARLTRANRQALGHAPATVTVVRAHAGSPQLAYALAASLAWHTRAKTLLLSLDDTPGTELVGSASTERQPHAAAIMVGSPHDLPAGHRFEQFVNGGLWRHIVVYVRGEPPPWLGGCTLTLARATGGERAGTFALAGSTYAIPALQRADLVALQAGLLPSRTPAGAEIGRLARRLAGLRVGLALGAGSMRGYSHIGVLRVLERAGLTPDCLAGTSVGAGVAGLFALGYGPSAIEDVLDTASRRAFRFSSPTRALVSSQGLATMMRRLAENTLIESLPLPLGIVAVDLVQGREIVFDRGSLWRAVLASTAIPGIYPAQRMSRYVLVDGGVLNPVPSSAAFDLGGDIVIGVRLGDPDRGQAQLAVAREGGGSVPSMLRVVGRTLRVMQNRISLDVAEQATILIEPGLEPRTGRRAGVAGELRRLRDARPYVALGEAAAEAALPRITDALPWLRSAR